MKLSSIPFYLKRPRVAFAKLRFIIQTKLHPDEPWLVRGAVKYCDSVLNKDMVVFEWGSGRSTAWFAKRSKKVVSIEYNPQWFEIVKKDMAEKGVSNIDLRYIPPDHDLKEPTLRHYEPMPKYITAIDEFPEVDFIIVDGHYRRACVNYGMKHLKPGGYLLIDDTYREQNIEDWEVPSDWEFVHQSANGVMETSIWRKPS